LAECNPIWNPTANSHTHELLIPLALKRTDESNNEGGSRAPDMLFYFSRRTLT
jgi:hypothetical protein